MTSDNNHETLDFPEDIGLPFFAYGIFKPGQLAYSKIRNHVDEENLRHIEIGYGMRHRDGVPILMHGECGHCHTKGVVITFRRNQERKAYDIIRKTLLNALYQWKTIEINGKDVNILFGVDPDNGSDPIESHRERVDFDGKNDPLFNEAMELIERNLNSDNACNMESFFELQMNYMLLWTAIDRYSSLKFNRPYKNQNYERFANQKAFRDGIKRYGGGYHRPVYSTDDLRMHEFNVDDHIESIYYYYTLRCNVVHRGKSMFNDYDLLETATRELLEIFKDVLRVTFYET